MNRRLALFALLSATVATATQKVQAASSFKFEVFRNPGCGCCEQWVDHMRKAGFDVSIQDDPDLNGRLTKLGVAPEFSGCHIAQSGGYAFIGHIPAVDVFTFLGAPPKDAIGLAVPGMPVGSPGMGPEGSGDPYDVYLLTRDAEPSVFAKH